MCSLECEMTEEACSMAKRLRKIDFSLHSGHGHYIGTYESLCLEFPLIKSWVRHWKLKEASKPHNSSRKRSAQTSNSHFTRFCYRPCWTDFAQILTQDAEIHPEKVKSFKSYAKPFRSENRKPPGAESSPARNRVKCVFDCFGKNT